jgi:chromate reductase
VTPGGLGAFGANHHLRQSLVFVDMPCLQQPEVYVANAAKVLDGDRLIDDKLREFLGTFVDAFAAWVDRFTHPHAAHSAA